ncbi:hypothetical protein LMIY3S_05484 [Labrys miyagiensis]
MPAALRKVRAAISDKVSYDALTSRGRAVEIRRDVTSAVLFRTSADEAAPRPERVGSGVHYLGHPGVSTTTTAAPPT